MRRIFGKFGGFTLFELVVVLGILSAMVAVILPFCKRSNEGLKIKQVSSSIAQAMRYGIELAEGRNLAVKFFYDGKNRSYWLEIEDGENIFKPVENFAGAERFIDAKIELFDIEGFEQAGQEYSIVFDPRKAWPDGLISLCTEDLIITVRVKSKDVEIEEESV